MVTPSCDRMKPSRDVCTPALCRIKTSKKIDDRVFRPRRMHEGDRGYLHSQIAANAVQGSSTATGSHEGEGGAWRLLYDSRRPDIPRQDSLTRGSGRPIAPTQRMNMRPWFGSAVLACAIHSFLGGGNKQPVELLADEDGDYPASVVDAQMDGRTASGADAKCAMSASLIGPSGSSTFRLSINAMSMSLAGSCFSSESAPGPFHHGIRGRGGTIC